MTIYDAAMAIVVVAGMVRGAWRGITWQLASIASLVLGYLSAYPISAQIAPYFPGEPAVARALSMLVAYAAVSAGVFGVAWLIRGTLHKLKFDAYDRHLGMLLGGMEAVCVGILVTLFLVSLAPAMREPIFASPTGRVVGTVMNTLGPVLPGEVRRVLAPFWNAASPSSGTLTTTAPAPASPTTSDATLPPLAEADRTNQPSAPIASLPELPPLEAPPGNDSAVRPAAAFSPRSSVPAAPDIEESGKTDTVDRLLDRGKEEARRAFSKALETPPTQTAESVRRLVGQEKQRLQNAVNDSLNQGKQVKQNAKDRLSKGQQQLNQAISDSITKGQQQVEQAIADRIDRELRRIGGLEPAPEKTPK